MIQLPPLEQQTAFNLQRWFELQNDPDLAFANSIDFFVCGMSSLVGQIRANARLTPPVKTLAFWANTLELWWLAESLWLQRKKSTGRNAHSWKSSRECKAALLCCAGTRMPVSAIVDNFEYGVSVAEIAEQFEVPPDRVEASVDLREELTALHILFDKNVPVGVRRFLAGHDVRTFVEMQWHPQLDNGEASHGSGKHAGFDVLVTSDQNIRYQQNLIGRKLALVVLGSNIWPVVRDYEAAIDSEGRIRQNREAMPSSKCRQRESAGKSDKVDCREFLHLPVATRSSGLSSDLSPLAFLEEARISGIDPQLDVRLDGRFLRPALTPVRGFLSPRDRNPSTASTRSVVVLKDGGGDFRTAGPMAAISPGMGLKFLHANPTCGGQVDSAIR